MLKAFMNEGGDKENIGLVDEVNRLLMLGRELKCYQELIFYDYDIKPVL